MVARHNTRRRRIAAVVLICLGVVLLLVGIARGCAGSLDREQLILRADEICRKSNAAFLAIPASERRVDLADTARAAVAVKRANAPGFVTTRGLAELVPDASMAERYLEFIRLRGLRDQLATQVSRALEDGDPTAAGNAQTAALRLYDGPIRDQAETIGFKVCGQPVGG